MQGCAKTIRRRIRTDSIFGSRVLPKVAHRPAAEGAKDLIGARYFGELLGCLESPLEFGFCWLPVIVNVLLVLEVAGRACPATE